MEISKFYDKGTADTVRVFWHILAMCITIALTIFAMCEVGNYIDHAYTVCTPKIPR